MKQPRKEAGSSGFQKVVESLGASPDEKCFRKTCSKPFTLECKYCKEHFCKEHIKAKPPVEGRKVDSLPEETKERIVREWKDKSGHQCEEYLDHWLKGTAVPQGKGKPSKKPAKEPGSSRRKPIIILIIILGLVVCIYYFRNDIPVLQDYMTCSDGTPNKQCSVQKPFYCQSGNLVKIPDACGCQEGYKVLNSVCVPGTTCYDGTPSGACSPKKPFFCDSGFLVDKASLCGCPDYFIPSWINSSPTWNTTSKFLFNNPRWYTNEITYTLSNNCTGSQAGKMRVAVSTLMTAINKSSSLLIREASDGCPQILVKCLNASSMLNYENGVADYDLIRNHEGYYSLIRSAEIYLTLGDNQCPRPNVQLHELLHTLGFDHSSDPTDTISEKFGCLQELKNSTIRDLVQIYPK